jgi:hypothetical protein
MVGKPEGRRLGRLRSWVDSTTIIDLRVIGWDGIDWIHLAQDREQFKPLVNMVMNLRVLENGGKPLSGFTIGSYSRSAQLQLFLFLLAYS